MERKVEEMSQKLEQNTKGREKRKEKNHTVEGITSE